MVFCLAPAFLGATLRQYGFMLKGLQEVAGDLAELNLPFFLLTGEPARELPSFVAHHRVGAVVSDFSPLRLVRGWKTAVAERIGVSLEEVDAHNVVPCWVASPKAEYGAYTLRPKLKRLLPTFLEDFPALARHPVGWAGERPEIPWKELPATLDLDPPVPEVTWISPGERQARAGADAFPGTEAGRSMGSGATTPPWTASRASPRISISGRSGRNGWPWRWRAAGATTLPGRPFWKSSSCAGNWRIISASTSPTTTPLPGFRPGPRKP